MDKSGILMENVEPDGTEPKYYDLKLRYNLKKALIVRNRSIAVSFLKRADKTVYGALRAELKNQYTMVSYQYPNEITTAYSIQHATQLQAPTSVKQQ